MRSPRSTSRLSLSPVRCRARRKLEFAEQGEVQTQTAGDLASSRGPGPCRRRTTRRYRRQWRAARRRRTDRAAGRSGVGDRDHVVGMYAENSPSRVSINRQKREEPPCRRPWRACGRETSPGRASRRVPCQDGPTSTLPCSPVCRFASGLTALLTAQSSLDFRTASASCGTMTERSASLAEVPGRREWAIGVSQG